MAAIEVPQFQSTPWYEPDRVDAPVVAGERRRAHRRPRATPRQLRRRRFAVLMAVAAVVLGIAALASAVPGGGGGDASTAGSAPDGAIAIVGDVYVVQPGDSLWSIAERLTPGGDPRPVVRELRERHGAVELSVGDRLPIDGLNN